MAEERLNILKEILSATTVEDAIRLKKKYKDFLVTPDEAEVINRHWSHLKQEQCIKKSKGDIPAYIQCSLSDSLDKPLVRE